MLNVNIIILLFTQVHNAELEIIIHFQCIFGEILITYIRQKLMLKSFIYLYVISFFHYFQFYLIICNSISIITTANRETLQFIVSMVLIILVYSYHLQNSMQYNPIQRNITNIIFLFHKYFFFYFIPLSEVQKILHKQATPKFFCNLTLFFLLLDYRNFQMHALENFTYFLNPAIAL